MKDEKLIHEYIIPITKLGAKVNVVFTKLFYELNEIHSKFDNEESNLEEDCVELDRKYANAENDLNCAYKKIMSVINK